MIAAQQALPGERGFVSLSCPDCGAATQSLPSSAENQRQIRYRNLRALTLPDSISVRTCRLCRRSCLDIETGSALQRVLDGEYRRILRQRIRIALDTVCRFTSQRKLEQLLGMSQGYLSRLKAGAGTPSPELVSHLALLANDPPVRLRELELYLGQVTDSGEILG